MSLPECQTLLLKHERGILHVTLNRPESRNALNQAMVAELNALGGLHTYNPARSVMGWLVGIARNVMRDECKIIASRAGPVSRGDLDDAAWDRLNGIVSSTADGQISAETEEILRCLTPSARQALESYYWSFAKSRSVL